MDLSKGLLLETRTADGHFGYYQWSYKGIKKLVLSTTSRLDQLIQSEDSKVFAFTEERYDLPPRLVILRHNEKEGKILVQSNAQHKQFYWGKSELIEYKNAKGKSLKGLLYYPAQYDASKKYPMIVYIYEQLTNDLHHQYLNPSQIYGDSGFNISSFTTQGYFVLAPDITYQLGDPGMSATDCVVSATKEIVSRGLVIPDKIGLTGHSFGGYETDFIITQTDLFAAALAGAAVTDFTSFYHTVGWDTRRPEMWRFESQQWRMGKSFFDDQEGFRRNSPIEHAKNITTPLLSWSGKEDLWINWNQSVEFYLALRRLGKKNIMLLYPKEGHSLSTRKNMIDLSVRFHEWFDFHLKGTPAAPWIKRGLL